MQNLFLIKLGGGCGRCFFFLNTNFITGIILCFIGLSSLLIVSSSRFSSAGKCHGCVSGCA